MATVSSLLPPSTTIRSSQNFKLSIQSAILAASLPVIVIELNFGISGAYRIHWLPCTDLKIPTVEVGVTTFHRSLGTSHEKTRKTRGRCGATPPTQVAGSRRYERLRDRWGWVT